MFERGIPGLVPLYEEHDVRIESHYTLTAWRDLLPEDRALEVAHYRLRHMKSLHEGSAAADHMKRKTR